MSVEVVSVTSRIPDRAREPYYRYELWLESLARFGVTPTVLGMGEPWHGLMTKPRRLRDWLREGGCKAEWLIVCDSYDVVFTAHPNEVAPRTAPGMSGSTKWIERTILFNAEKGLFPRSDLQHVFDRPVEKSPPVWRYLNSGLYIGAPVLILRLLESMMLDDIHGDYQRPDGSWVHPSDQGWYQYAYAAQPVPMALDWKCELFQTCSACDLGEFDLSGERVRNVATGTEPLVWHFNGGSKNDIMPAMLEKWGFAA